MCPLFDLKKITNICTQLLITILNFVKKQLAKKYQDNNYYWLFSLKIGLTHPFESTRFYPADSYFSEIPSSLFVKIFESMISSSTFPFLLHYPGYISAISSQHVLYLLGFSLLQISEWSKYLYQSEDEGKVFKIIVLLSWKTFVHQSFFPVCLIKGIPVENGSSINIKFLNVCWNETMHAIYNNDSWIYLFTSNRKHILWFIPINKDVFAIIKIFRIGCN